jgi:prepilin-type N-terminal cleavage/methylation domain-containing protein
MAHGLNAHPAQSRRAFTLVELLVSMAVMVLVLVLILQLFNSTAALTGMGNKHMDADAQARALLDRMAIDFAAMVKRSDVDYYLKGRPASNDQNGGNDQIAFFSEVAGYSSGSPSPVSLVAYRLNSSTKRVERLGKGLLWNAASATGVPVVFLPIPMASPLPSPLPSPMPATAPAPAWPQAASTTATDPDYELIGPHVFRFEYYYILKGQDVSAHPSILSDTPWDTRSPLSHDSVNGLRDVAAIGVVIAVLDSRSRALASDSDLATLAGQMDDFKPAMEPGDLEAQWQVAINASALPRVASSAIRIYSRCFYLHSPNP